MKKTLSFLLGFYYTIGAFAQVATTKTTQAIQAPPAAPVVSAISCANGHTKIWDKTYGGNSYDELYAMAAANDGGYLLGGSTRSGISGVKTTVNYGGADFWIVKIDANGTKLWDRTVGTSNYDVLMSIIKTTDGGFLLGGYSQGSYERQDDYWVIKIDADGNILWDKYLGGTGNEYLNAMAATSDGGYIVGGYSNSGISGDKTEPEIAPGENDYWVVKLDANGNKLWDKTFGGTSTETLAAILPTSDGGYLIGGNSYSGISGNKTADSKGDTDCWVIKTDANGNKLWDKTFGGSGSDNMSCIIATHDGKYMIGGSSSSGISGDKSENSFGSSDCWAIKIDTDGTKLWDKSYGGDDVDGIGEILLTNDGGYLLSGSSYSGISGSKSEASHGYFDFWLIKINATGNKVWDKTYGAMHNEGISGIVDAGNGDYVMAGSSGSDISGDKTQNSYGSEDFWVLKMNTCLPVTTLCEGQSYTLSATGCDGGIVWSTGAVGTSIQVSTAGTYTATCFANNETSPPSNSIVIKPGSMNLNGTATGGTSQAVNTITSTQTIPSGVNSTYQAGKSISLQGTFQAQTGSVFKAEIKGCE